MRPQGRVTDWRDYDFETGEIAEKDDLDYEAMLEELNTEYAWGRIHQCLAVDKEGFTHIVEWVDGFGDSSWFILKIEEAER